jgi:tetratricopeptide (TPR) repeat protein
LGDFPQAIQDAEKALELAIDHHANDTEAKAYNLLAHLKYNQSFFDEVLRLSRKVIDNASNNVSQTELAKAYLWSGMASASLSEYSTALTQLQEAENICLAINNNQTLADILGAVAFVYYSQKKLESALTIMQRAVKLSKSFSTPVKIGFILNNIALIQLNLGRPHEALKTLNESAALAKETSQNLLAYTIVNKAEVNTYLGKFNEALSDLEKAVNLFTVMNDEIGLVEAYLLLGYEYYPAINKPKLAKQALDSAQKLIEFKQESYLEQQVRILTGYASIEIISGAAEGAIKTLNKAGEIADQEGLIWWIPAIAYQNGKAQIALNNLAEAQNHLNNGLKSIENGGCPDYLAPILLQLGLIEEDSNRQADLLKQCLLAAEQRSRHIDKINCFKKAGQILANHIDPDLNTLGQKYLSTISDIQIDQR